MTGLYPTPTRLALLDAVAAGVVYRGNSRDWDETDGTDQPRLVDVRMAELEREGWVSLNGRRWLLTDDGRRVRAAHGRGLPPVAGRGGAT